MCKWELSSPCDSYAVIVVKGKQTVGHLQGRYRAFALALFLGRGSPLQPLSQEECDIGKVPVDRLEVNSRDIMQQKRTDNVLSPPIWGIYTQLAN